MVETKHDEDARTERMKRYAIARAAALEAIKATGAVAMPLDSAARLLPDNPEWTAGVPRRRRRVVR